MTAMPETRAFEGERRERKSPQIDATMETRASVSHPGHDEDASLGDVARIRREQANFPEIHTSNWDADLDAIARAGETELRLADALKERGVYGVLDGVSGSKNEGAGLVTSRLAAAKIAEVMAAMPADATAESALPAIESAITQAHRAVFEHSSGRPDFKEMGTTADVIKIVDNHDGTFDVAYGHVGDSRIYVFDNETGKLRTETMDDNLAKAYLEGGRVAGNVFPKTIDRAQYDAIMQAGSASELPAKLRKFYNERNIITNYIGFPTRDITVATGIFKMKKGDVILQTTDGIHDNLTDAQIEDVLKKGGGARELIEAASAVVESGKGRAKPDDMTVNEITLGIEQRPMPTPEKSARALHAVPTEERTKHERRRLDEAQQKVGTAYEEATPDMSAGAHSESNPTPASKKKPWYKFW